MLVAFDRLPWVALDHPAPRPRCSSAATSSSCRAATSSRSRGSARSHLGPLRVDRPRARDGEGNLVAARAASGSASRSPWSRPGSTSSRRGARSTVIVAADRCCHGGQLQAGRGGRRGEIVIETPKPQAEVDPFATLHLRAPSSRTERQPWKRSPTCSRSPTPSCRPCSRSIEDGEEAISRRRRVLHGRIDILRAERTERLKAQVAAGSFEAKPPTSFERPIYEGTGDVPDEADLDAAAGPRRAGRRRALGGDPARSSTRRTTSR